MSYTVNSKCKHFHKTSDSDVTFRKSLKKNLISEIVGANIGSYHIHITDKCNWKLISTIHPAKHYFTNSVITFK